MQKLFSSKLVILESRVDRSVAESFLGILVTENVTFEVLLKNCARLCGCCEGAVCSVISVFTQLHSGLNLEFKTLFESNDDLGKSSLTDKSTDNTPPR